MNFFTYYNWQKKEIYEGTSIRIKRKKKSIKQNDLWDEYLSSENVANDLMILKKIKRCQKNNILKYHINYFINKDIGIIKQNNIKIQTIRQVTFKATVDIDLSSIILSNSLPEIEIITSSHITFNCPICYENGILLDVILQCKHCLCKSCHEMMILQKKEYACPVCRKDMCILEKEKGPTLHFAR